MDHHAGGVGAGRAPDPHPRAGGRFRPRELLDSGALPFPRLAESVAWVDHLDDVPHLTRPAMVALPAGPDPLDALMTLLSRRRAVHRIDGLPARLKVGPDELATLLDVALDEGRVELWPDAPCGSSVLMSALEARRRGLVLDGGHEELTHRWRWVRPGQVKPLRATSLVEADMVAAAGGFDRMADRKLGMLAVCVICHRSGADHLFKPIPRAMLPKPPKADRADDNLTGGKGRAKAGRLKTKARGKGKRATATAR